MPFLISLILVVAPFGAQRLEPALSGRVVDQTGGVLPGVSVQLTSADLKTVLTAVTGVDGRYEFVHLADGRWNLTFSVMNFGDLRRPGVQISTGAPVRVDVTMQLSLNAAVVVTAHDSFRNLAELDNPSENLVGIAAAASEGAVTARQIAARPLTRPGEVLESVPGVIISQHSGEGKANQYYLRGFNLDHGTDFSTTVAGLPVNLPTHAHGQGYSDLNFLIPELVTGVQFKKGPYSVREGDFSAAGSANINYANRLRSSASLSMGQEGWSRLLVATSPSVRGGPLLAAIEVSHNDGPWVSKDDYTKVNGVVRYSRGNALSGFSLTGMGYTGSWNSTDQVPNRAIESGAISRFGNIDASSGGRTARYSLVADYQRTSGDTLTRATAFVSKYRLNLFSNFTYLLDDPELGDQFEQADRRWVTGARVSRTRRFRWSQKPGEITFGFDGRNDDISVVGLYHTARRVRLETIRQDAVNQTSASMFVEQELRWLPWLRATAGVRLDAYRFHVRAGDPENSGIKRSEQVSPKGGVTFGPWKETEFYVNAGAGLHSNDARGTTITRDPASGDAANAVTPLVRAKGAEVGVRSTLLPRIQTTVAVWRLTLESEQLFVGDAGTTEAGRPSERYGIEWTNYARLSSAVAIDADVAWSQARFTNVDPAGMSIPGAPQVVAALGVTVDRAQGAFGSLRWRYFGPRPLTEDNSVRSASTSLLNGQIGFHLTPRAHVVADLFNLLNTSSSDVDYFYASRLAGEPAEGVSDIHSHPALPRTVRILLRVQF